MKALINVPEEVIISEEILDKIKELQEDNSDLAVSCIDELDSIIQNELCEYDGDPMKIINKCNMLIYMNGVFKVLGNLKLKQG